MLVRVLADIVVLVHLIWIFFLIAGAYWGRRHRLVMLVHAAGLVFAVISQILGWYCPLTHLEAWLRRRQDPSLAYPGSFIAHYAEQIIYIDLSPTGIFLLTLACVFVQALFYRTTFRGNGRPG